MMNETLLGLLFLALVIILLALIFHLRAEKEVSEKEIEGKYFDSPCGPLFYQTHGKKGPWILMVHGIGSSTYCWRNIVPEFKDNYRILTVDLWGFGYSSKDLSTPMSLDEQVNLLKALITYLNIANYYYVGHSLGGEIGLWLALKDQRMEKCIAITPSAHPKLVSNIVKKFTWVAKWTPVWLSKKTIHRLLMNLIREKSLIDEEMIESYYRPYQEASAHLSFAAALNIISDPRVFNSLHKVPKGTVMLWGKTDQVIPKRIAQKIQSKTPQVEHFTHPTAGHLPTEDDYPWVVAHLKAQLK